MDEREIDAWRLGFGYGFAASGEGWNGEYPEGVMDTERYAGVMARALEHAVAEQLCSCQEVDGLVNYSVTCANEYHRKRASRYVKATEAV